MATRFYLSSTATTPVTPAFESWTRTADGDRLKMSPTKDGSAAASKTFGANGSVAANGTVLNRQYVSDPMAAGISFTTAQTFSSQIRCLESAVNDNINRAPLCIKVVSLDGNTIQATLKALAHYGLNTTEWPTTLTNKTVAASSNTLGANYTTVSGDRLVFEIGGQVDATGGTTVTGTQSFGSPSGTDLAVDEVTTTANNPFLELSTTITFIFATSQSDAVTVSESVQPNMLLFPRPNDSVTVAESITPNLIVMPQQSDSVAVAESVTPNLIVMPKPSDSVTVAESVALNLLLLPQVSDAVTVADSAAANYPIVVTEYVQVVIQSAGAVGDLTAPVSDSVSVSESVAASLLLSPQASDDVTVTDSASALLPQLNTAVQDSVSVSDPATASIVMSAQGVDSVAVTDVVTALLPVLNTATQDSVSAADAAIASVLMAAQASDAVSVNESATALLPFLTPAAQDAVSVAESINAILPQLFASALDSVSLSEDVAVLLPFLVAAVAEAVTVAEDVTVDRSDPGILEVEAFDAVAVSEDLTVKLARLVIAASDDVAIADIGAANFLLSLSVADPVGAGEDVLVVLPFLVADVSDAVQVTEAVTALLPVLVASVFEDVAVSDGAHTEFASAFLLNINVGDDVAVAEDAAVTGADEAAPVHVQVGPTWVNVEPRRKPLLPPMMVSAASGQSGQTTRATVTMSMAAAGKTTGMATTQADIEMRLEAVAMSLQRAAGARAFTRMSMRLTARTGQRQAATAQAAMAMQVKIMSRMEPRVVPSYDGPAPECEMPEFELAA